MLSLLALDLFERGASQVAPCTDNIPEKEVSLLDQLGEK